MEATNVIELLPELPVELVLLIIETLLQIEPNRASDLLCLSRDIQPMVKKALYDCVILKSQWATDCFIYAIKLGLVGPDSVKTLCVAATLTLDELLTLFSACIGAQNIAVYAWYTGDLKTDAKLGAASWLSAPDNNRFSLPLFQHLTHLDFYFSFHDRFNTTQLHSLTNLTHISLIMFDCLDGDVERLFSNFSLADSIQVCIILVDVYSFTRMRSQCEDPRVVFSFPHSGKAQGCPVNTLRHDLPAKDYFIRQWGRRMDKGEMDMWEEAEAIVAVQRALQAAGRPFTDRLSTPMTRCSESNTLCKPLCITLFKD
ncbi:hypothetical protein C8J56DRAFT_1053600 [Mycena floridula]|nr:hypothetical protein C8J56DRAFT_1053600 [Mycena floridula]